LPAHNLPILILYKLKMYRVFNLYFTRPYFCGVIKLINCAFFAALSLLASSCSSYVDDKSKPADVYLVPFEGFDKSFADLMAVRLSKNIGVTVRVSETQPIPPKAYNSERKQYVGIEFVMDLYKLSTKLPDKTSRTIYIALLEGSLYDPKADFEYLFSTNFAGKYVVVGNREMRLIHASNDEDYELRIYGVDPFSKKEIYELRMFKILKRAIGRSYFHYPLSDNPESIMKKSIHSVYDLDAADIEY